MSHQAVVGGQYYIRLGQPRTENELCQLVRQLQNIDEHFEEIGRLARMLKNGDNSEVNDKGRWDPREGDKLKNIWSPS